MRAAWLWLRVHVIYWRDGWPVVTTRRAINGEVGYATPCTAAPFPSRRQLRLERTGMHVVPDLPR